MKRKTVEKIDAVGSVKAAKGKRGISDTSKESAHLLHSIVQGFSIPAFVIGVNHKILYWNRALERLTNIPMSEVVDTNQHWRAFYASERPCMADLLIDGAENRIPKWYAGKYRKSDLLEEAYEATDFFPDLGEKGALAALHGRADSASDGNIVGAIETLEDITERMTAELTRHESEQQVFSIIEGSPIPTFVIGLDHNVIYWNRALEKLSKIRAKDMIGTNQHWRAFYASERPCMSDLVVDQTMETMPEWYRGRCQIETVRRQLRGGRIFPRPGRQRALATVHRVAPP